MDWSNTDRSKEVQPTRGFGSRWIGMEKHNSCSRPQHNCQHNWDKALIMIVMIGYTIDHEVERKFSCFKNFVKLLVHSSSLCSRQALQSSDHFAKKLDLSKNVFRLVITDLIISFLIDHLEPQNLYPSMSSWSILVGTISWWLRLLIW